MPIKNIPLTERKIRFLIAIFIIFMSLILLSISQTHLAIAVFGIGLIPLATSLTGTCPVYCAIKNSTK